MISVSHVSKRIRKSLGVQYTNDAHSPSDIVDYINSSIRRIATDGLFNFLIFHHEFTATGNSSRYTLPESYSIKYLYKDGKMLTPWVDWMDDYENRKDIMRGVIYTNYNYIILPDPKDVSTYAIDYRGTPRQILYEEADNGTIDLPEAFTEPLIFLWVYYGMMDIKEVESSKEYLEAYLMQLPRIKSLFSDRMENMPDRIWSSYRF